MVFMLTLFMKFPRFKIIRVLIAAALLLAAPRLHAAGPALSGAEGPNLILIGWDTLRADHVGALGYERKTTPNLDGLAARSFLFTRAISPASWTLPAFMSVFTGLYPSEHGMTNKYSLPAAGSTKLEPASLSTGVATLAQLLKTNGYKTAAFTGGAGVGGSYGFSRGFDVYVDSPNFTGFGTSFPQALDWLRDNPGSGTFVFIHGYDTHPFRDLKADGNYSFIPPEEAAKVPELRARHEKMRMELLDGKKLQYTNDDVKLWTGVYDEKILRADKLLGKFLTDLSALGKPAGETIIILLSDHGEELFDHGGVDHGMTLYDELLRVPLLIYVPHRPGRTINAQVRTLDVFPTVMELLGLRQGESLRGQLRGTSLVGHMNGAGEPLDAFSETDYLFHFNKKAVRKSNGQKLISDGLTQGRELYDTSADPAEKTDLFEKDSARAYILEMALFDWEESLKTP
ncbi:MAG: sulfatase [Elusimicrobia bacterium]|nr:sulfatase [Elusimicrobiota bacterium]